MNSERCASTWREATIGEISRTKPTNGIFKKNEEYCGSRLDGLPVVWVEDLFKGNSIIPNGQSRSLIPSKSDVQKYGLRYGDLLFCRSSLKLDGIAYNNVYLGDDDAALFECHIIRISPKLDVVCPRYLNWLLRTPRLRAIAKSKAKTATMTTIDQTTLSSIPITFPTLAEQRRIAAMLDAAEALRIRRRAALAKLDSLTQSIFLEMFGDSGENPMNWPVRRVADYVAEFRGGKSMEAENGENAITRNRVLKVSAVTGMKFLPNESKPVPDSYEPPPEHFVRSGDLLFSRANTTDLVGAVAYVENAPRNLLLPDKLWRFVWQKPAMVEPLFIWSLFQTATVRREIGRRATGTSGSMKNISQEKVFGISTIVPPLTLQRAFTLRVGAIERMKLKHRTALDKTDALFSTIQHRAFRGEL